MIYCVKLNQGRRRSIKSALPQMLVLHRAEREERKESRCASGSHVHETFDLFVGTLIYQGTAPGRVCD